MRTRSSHFLAAFSILLASVSIKSDRFIFIDETPRILATTALILFVCIYFLCKSKKAILEIPLTPFLITILLISIYLVEMPQQNRFFMAGTGVGLIFLFICLSNQQHRFFKQQAFFLSDLYRFSFV
ncbi:hypothetical protein D2U88_06865 [Flagellimonas aequoris]|uniref:Uncharacterized protein n=1 Tax=Flagellimonas aequoris TaxID=2306997 RepID=A0A418N9G0_9FLAO|nr:hypothetical protein D2U88_06865 [Allomuricauda aequoris]